MGAIKPLAILTLVIVMFAGHVHAQPQRELLYYYWITPDEVWLWQAKSDVEPVKATYDPGSSRWTINPSGGLDRWRKMLEETIPFYYRGVQVERPTDELLQSFVLAKLRNGYPLIPWAREYPPAVQIDVALQSASNAEVAVFVENKSRKLFNFTPKNNVWSKGNQNLSLAEVFNVTESPAELARIFSFNSTPANFNTAWNTWITDTMLSGKRVEQFSYVDQAKQPRWILRERFEPGAVLRAALEPSPKSFNTIPEPQLNLVKAASGSVNFPYKYVGIGLLVLLFVVLFFVRPVRNRLLTLLPGSNGKSSDGTQVAPTLPLTESTLNSLHLRAIERCKKRYETNDANTFKLLVTCLEVVKGAYDEVAQELLKEEKDQDQEARNAYRVTLGVEKDSDEQIRNLIILGRQSKELVSKARQFKLPNEVEDLIGKQKRQSWSDDEYLGFYSDVVNAFGTALSNARNAESGLTKQLAQKQQEHEQKLANVEADLKKTSNERIDALNKDNIEHEKEKKALEKKVEALTAEGKNLQGEIEQLNGKLNEAAATAATSEKTSEVLRKKFDQVRDVEELSHTLRKWVQGYHQKHMSDTKEIRSVSILSSLINFSVGQMCFGVVDEKEALTKACAHNILKLTRGTPQSGNSPSLLQSIESYVVHLVPDVSNTMTDFTNEHTGGNTFDEPLFRDFLNWLKRDTGHDSSPFFIDLDNKQQKLVFVSAG